MEDFIKSAAEEIKNRVMSDFKDLKKERGEHAESIIRSHIIFSMGAGVIPIPVADVLAVSASQLDMIRQLCKVYDVDFHETQGKAIVSALTVSTLARLGAGSVAKLIPIVGQIAGSVANAILSGASTYALGQVFKAHFETGGTILDFDSDRLKKMYREQFEKGKKVAEELRRQQDAKKKAEETSSAATPPPPPATPPPPVTETSVAQAPVVEIVESEKIMTDKETITRLKELGELKANGIITDAEFEQMKKRIIGS